MPHTFFNTKSYISLQQPRTDFYIGIRQIGEHTYQYDNCPLGTKVEIFDSNDLGGVEKPTTIKIADDDPRRGWDPTDPDPANPWKAN